MTNPTPHGQVPEALIDLIDAYAETRHRCGGIYNAKTEAARNAVIEALSGVQALSAAPAPAIGDELRDTLVAVSAAIAERDDRAAQKMICEILAASTTPPAEQQATTTEGCMQPMPDKCDQNTWRGPYYHLPLTEQAAPKAAPGEPHDHQILAITTAYEQGVGKGRQAYSSGKEIANPYGPGYRCDLAWQYGYEEGKEQAERIAEAAPQPAPAPISDDTKRLNWLLWKLPGDALRYVVGELADTSSGAEFRAAIDAALAAQGGKV